LGYKSGWHYTTISEIGIGSYYELLDRKRSGFR
jgi:hypothetical protein